MFLHNLLNVLLVQIANKMGLQKKFYAVRVVRVACGFLYRLIVARQRLGRSVPVITKNCWRRRFQYGSCRIKENSRLDLTQPYCYYLNYWVMHPVARLSINIYIYIYIETSVRNKYRCSFYCALLTLHGTEVSIYIYYYWPIFVI
jgi:hypothetical protein